MARQDWPTNGTIVEVEWIDSATTNGWHDEFDLDDGGLITCRSVGYLLSRDRRSVQLVQSQSSHGASAELTAIPRSCVRSIKTLARTPKRKR